MFRFFRSFAVLLPIGLSLGATPAQAQATITLATGFEVPCGVAVDASGNVFAIASATNEVKEIEAVDGIIPASPVIRDLGSGFSLPCGIAVDGSGNVFLADTGNNLIKEIVAVDGSIPDSPTINTLAGGFGFNLPGLVALDSSGNLFVGDNSSHALYELPAAGGYSAVNTVGSGFTSPGGVAIDASGNVFVADGISGGGIYEIEAVDGSIPATPVIRTLATGFNFPSDIKVDASGNVYVADTLNRAVKEILAVDGSIPASPAIVTLGSGFGFVLAIALDGQGNVFVGDDTPGAVKEILVPPTATQAVASTSLTQNDAAVAFTPVTGAGGRGPLGYSVSPSLPAGLSLDPATGTITGTATVASPTASYTVTVTDSVSDIGTASFSLTVNGVVLATQAVPTTTLAVNQAAGFTPVTGSGGTAALAYAVAPALPAGLAMAAGTGAVTGTPTVATAATSYTVTVTDANGAAATAGFSLGTLAATAAIGTTALVIDRPAAAFIPVAGSGGSTPLFYAVSPALPAGLGMASATGMITGTPTVISPAARYTVTVTDGNDVGATAGFSLSVGQPTTTTTLTASPNPSSYGQAVGFSATVAGTNGTPTGTVTFAADGAPLAAVALAGSAASYTTAALTVGSHAITATYSGDANFTGSTSSVLGQTVAAVAASDQVYAYQTTIGVTGVPGGDNGHFSNVAVGAVDTVNGHLLVADNANARVQVIDTASLAVVATLGVTGVPGNDNGHFDQPSSVGFDPATGRIFVADLANQRIQIFDAKSLAYLTTLGVTGVPGTDNGHFNLPASAQVNPATHQLYVAELGNHRVQIFDAGTLAYVASLGSAGTPGSDNAHFNQPSDAEFNPTTGQILVADSGNARIQIFDAARLAYVATLGGPGGNPADNGHFTQPNTASFDPASNLVLIADAGRNQRIQALDASSYAYVTTLGTAGSSGAGQDQFAGPLGIAADPAHRRIFVGDSGNDRIQVFATAPQAIFAATLPGARSVELGHPATIFASIVNAGASPLGSCRILLPVTAPAGLVLHYQTTDATTNTLTGTPDTPAAIAGNNGLQSFLVTLAGAEPVAAAAMPFDFTCLGTAPAEVVSGVDTIDLVLATGPVPDVIALAATPTGNGVVAAPVGGAGAFAVASDNVGAGGALIVSVDTGAASLPLAATICPSNPGTGQCLTTPAAAVPLNIAAGATPTFSVFVTASAPIDLAPATARVFVRFKDAAGTIHGATSVAVESK
jgi:sugar lactone lactonase YvrE